MAPGYGISKPETTIPAKSNSPGGAVPIDVAAVNLHHVYWPNVPISGQFCSVPGIVRLKDGQATGVSTKWGPVDFYQAGSTIYGELGGADLAAVTVWCDNGGGTADSQIAQAYILFEIVGGKLSALGAITAQEQPSSDVPVSYITKITFSQDTVAAHEAWYRGNDPTCCPSGTAVTIWTYAHGQLISPALQT